MTDKIHGYEDEHRVNCYGLRFRSDEQNTTPLNGGTTQQSETSVFDGGNQTSRDGLGDSCERSINGGDEPSGQIVCSECKAVTDCTVMGKCGKCYDYDEQNGGDEPSGDASTRKDEDSGLASNPPVKCNGLAPASPTKDCEACGAPCMDWQPCAKCWERIANRTPEEKEASLRALGIFPPSPSYTREWDMGDAHTVAAHTISGKPIVAEVPPTSYTREELVEIISFIEHDFTCVGDYCANQILDALIAIGAVRVK